MTALLALHAWLAVSATIDLGVTGDETVHLTGGYSYWKFNDYRLHPENGNLPQRWAALPLLRLQPSLDPWIWPNLWLWSDVWQIGQKFFFESGNSTDYFLLCARSVMVVWSLATGLLVFCWSRSLWGNRGALFSLSLYAFSPTTLAHGALVTSDVCATFWLLAATGAWWRLSLHIDARRLAASVVATGLLAVAKFSCVLLLPVVAVMILWRGLQRESILLDCAPFHVRRFTGVAAKFGILSGIGVLHLATTVLIIWAFFGFRYSAFNQTLPHAADFYASASGVIPDSGVYRWFLVTAKTHHWLPEAFLQGFAYVIYAARARSSFLAGEYSITGWWWFFPFAFFVKSSIAELLTFFSALVIATMQWIRSRTIQSSLLPLFILGGVYGTVSLFSHLNIGQRHILPLYPILFILGGCLLNCRSDETKAHNALKEGAGHHQPVLPFKIRPFIALLIGFLALVETTSIRPDYLAFFNQLAGGPENGRRLLGDSSLDWGQNLPRLAKWLSQHRQSTERVYVSSFGADDPFYRGIRPIELSPYYSFGRMLKWEALEPGLYCIGASMLQDASSPYSGPWTGQREAFYQFARSKINREIEAGTRSEFFRWDTDPKMELWNLDRARFARLCLYLRLRQPDAVVGRSIFIFRLSAEEIKSAVDGSLGELATAMENATQNRAH